MSDLMREEFEAWARKRSMDLEYRNFPGVGKLYECPRTLLAIDAWQASREYLVIELPADAHLSRDGLDEHYLAGDMRDQIVESIHAAGVKTK